MKRIILASGLAVIMVFSGIRGYAQGPDYKGMHSHDSMVSEKGHSVTPEQKAKFQEMRRKFMGENAQLIGALVAKRLELRSLWTDPKSDPKAILDKDREMRALQDQMTEKVVQTMLEVRKFLTPEQIAHWKPWRMWRMKQRGMMEHGGMMHGGMMKGEGMTGSGHEMGKHCTCRGM